MNTHTSFFRLIPLWILVSASIASAAETGWVALFNGKNLDDWTPKISGHATGVNVSDTFRVKDDILKAAATLPFRRKASRYGSATSNSSPWSSADR